MTLKEIHAKAGPLPVYWWYFFLVFLWYSLDNLYTSLYPAASIGTMETILEWGLKILVTPLISAGVFGGIHALQQSQESSSIGGFLTGIRKIYWRMLATYLLVLVFYFFAIIALSIAGLLPEDPDQTSPLVEIVAGINSAISLFWYAAITVERKVFHGFSCAIKTLLTNPYALATGVIWAVLSSADAHFSSASIYPASLALVAVRAAVLAAVRILAIAYALAIYKYVRGEAPVQPPEETLAAESTTESSGDGWVNASFGFTFFAFIPLVHFATLALGIIALRRKKQFVLKSAIACCVGGFFTIYYLLIVAGWVVAGTSPSGAPGYAFLADANPDLRQQVALLEQGSAYELQQQLEQNAVKDPKQDWTLDAILALAKYNNGDLDGALEGFRAAAAKEPDQGEFYYYHGVMLLENGQTEMASGQFQTALAREPNLEAAERYQLLIRSIREPTVIASSLLMIVVLLILFTVHEYGHAYAAWKLGDDTAKNMGRLTLNPVPHLDLIGSIILPGMMLFQQAGVIFGWAKPVPVNPENFKNPRKDHMRVSFAGPAVNFLVSLICFVALGFLMLLVRIAWPQTLSLNLASPYDPVSIVGPPQTQWIIFFAVFLKQMFYTSLILGCFNLLPIPPLDGSWILSGFLPEKYSALFEKVRRFSIILFLLLVITPVFDTLLAVPLGLAWAGFLIIFSAMGLG